MDRSHAGASPRIAGGKQHDCGLELAVGPDPPAQLGGQPGGELDAVAFDGDVDVGVGLLEQQVAHEATHQIDPGEIVGESRAGLEQPAEERVLGQRLHGVDLRGRRFGLLLLPASLIGGQNVGARGDADHVVHSAVPSRHRLVIGLVCNHGNAADVALDHDAAKFVDPCGGPGEGDVAGHDALDGGMSQAVSDSLVEVAPGDDAHHAAILPHADAGVAVALRRDQGFGDGGVGVDEADRPAHDLAGDGTAYLSGTELSSSSAITCRGILLADHRRSRLSVPAPLDGVKQWPTSTDAGSRPGGDEYPVLHAHRLEQHLGVDEFHELVGDDAQPVDVARYLERRHVNVDAPDPLVPSPRRPCA